VAAIVPIQWPIWLSGGRLRKTEAQIHVAREISSPREVRSVCEVANGHYRGFVEGCGSDGYTHARSLGSTPRGLAMG